MLRCLGAKVNTKTEETQETALTLSCCGGFIECVEVLLKAGADVEAGSSTPIMEASQEGHYDLVKYLHEEGTRCMHLYKIVQCILKLVFSRAMLSSLLLFVYFQRKQTSTLLIITEKQPCHSLVSTVTPKWQSFY